MLGPVILKLDVELGSELYKTPFDFKVSRSQIKVTVTLTAKKLDNAWV